MGGTQREGDAAPRARGGAVCVFSFERASIRASQAARTKTMWSGAMPPPWLGPTYSASRLTICLKTKSGSLTIWIPSRAPRSQRVRVERPQTGARRVCTGDRSQHRFL